MMGGQYKSNAGSVFSLKYHLVWCPKYRRNILGGNVVERLKELLVEKAYQLDVDIEALEIMPDHVHLFVSSNPTKAPQYLANQFKGTTSRVLRQEFAHLRTGTSVLWSRSYYVGSVGHVSEETVKKYIEAQRERD